MQSKEMSPSQRAAVVLEALKEQETLVQIASRYGISPKTLATWKKEFVENAPNLFGGNQRKQVLEKEKEMEALYQQIGQLQVEVNWLKKKSAAIKPK